MAVSGKAAYNPSTPMPEGDTATGFDKYTAVVDTDTVVVKLN